MTCRRVTKSFWIKSRAELDEDKDNMTEQKGWIRQTTNSVMSVLEMSEWRYFWSERVSCYILCSQILWKIRSKGFFQTHLSFCSFPFFKSTSSSSSCARSRDADDHVCLYQIVPGISKEKVFCCYFLVLLVWVIQVLDLNLPEIVKFSNLSFLTTIIFV